LSVSFSPGSIGAKSAAVQITSTDPDESPFSVALSGTGIASPAPDITVTPSSFDFGSVVTGTSATQSFQIRNDGTASLDVSATSLTGVNATEFNISSGGGAFTLAPGQSHALSVSFSPGSIGAKSAAVQISSNDPDESPFSVALSGSGVASPEPDITVIPASFDFGGIVIGASATHLFEVRNDGTAGLTVSATSLTGVNATEFNISSGGGAFTLAPGQSHALSVSFSPGSIGAKSAAVQITSNDADESPFTLPLSGTGVEAPAGGGEVGFQETQNGRALNSNAVTTSASLSGVAGDFYLAAISTRPRAEVVSVAGLGGTWTRVSTQCSGRGVTMVEVWQAVGVPAGAGPVTATLSAAVASSVISVSRYSGADPVDPIGSMVAGNSNGRDGGCSGGTDSPSYGLLLSTAANGSVVFGAAALRNKQHTAGPAYSERGEIHAGSGGSVSGVAVQDQLVATPSNVVLEGSFNKAVDWAAVGVEIRASAGGTQTPVPDLSVVPGSVDFGDVVVGSGSSRTLEVRNAGSADLLVSATDLTGADAAEFGVTGGGVFTLLPGQARNLEISFAPGSVGARSAVLQITSNDPDENPFAVALTGTVTSGAGGASLTFTPTDDAYVKSTRLTTNYGTRDIVRLRNGSTSYNSYLKFDVSGIVGSVQQAKLRLYVTDVSPDGGTVYLVSNSHPDSGLPWSESTLTWGNAPEITGAPLASAGSVTLDAWVELDVTAAILADGIYSFGLTNAVSNSVFYSSKEGSHPPELVVVTSPASQRMADPRLAMTHPANDAILPETTALYPNYPNPFNAETTIKYALPERARVTLLVFNLKGQVVKELVDAEQSPGFKIVRWDGRDKFGVDVSSGIYFLHLRVAGRAALSSKVILQK
ncbi:MAG: choice-of-anchor D domain-containing protein, partial [bacterium]